MHGKVERKEDKQKQGPFAVDHPSTDPAQGSSLPWAIDVLIHRPGHHKLQGRAWMLIYLSARRVSISDS